MEDDRGADDDDDDALVVFDRDKVVNDDESDENGDVDRSWMRDEKVVSALRLLDARSEGAMRLERTRCEGSALGVGDEESDVV